MAPITPYQRRPSRASDDRGCRWEVHHWGFQLYISILYHHHMNVPATSVGTTDTGVRSRTIEGQHTYPLLALCKE